MGLMEPLAIALPIPLVPFRAFVTDDAEAILQFAIDGFERLGSSALVTLVSVTGGAAREIGAQMAVHADGAFCGFVSGGCTESAVAAEALLAIEAGADRYLHLGEGSQFFDIVLPCGGSIMLHIHVLRESRTITDALAALATRATAALKLDPKSETISLLSQSRATGWSGETFIRRYLPKVQLIVCGRGIEVDITSRLARAAGFEVVVPDGPSSFDQSHIDHHTAVVILYHDLDAEIPVLRAALDGDPFYIGALGSKRTHAKRCDALQRLGYGRNALESIHAPIGLVKAKDAQTLGLSILTEIAAARNEVSAVF